MFVVEQSALDANVHYAFSPVLKTTHRRLYNVTESSANALAVEICAKDERYYYYCCGCCGFGFS